ncbi:MAG TPA: methyltransferase domain-containing protein [Trebonia sp.]
MTAFTETERHLFLPGTGLEAAYENDAVPVKHDRDGVMISCISAPSVVAIQLEQLGVRPGDKVLEAGAATGYNAALLASLAGPDGHVWTIDVDEDLVRDAAAHLKAARVANATVVLGDGAAGLPDDAPFDRVQFTVGSADIPPAILDQVAPGGRLVIPLRIRGSISRSVAFERDGDEPRGRQYRTRWRRSSRSASPPPTTPAPASRWPATGPSPWRHGTTRTPTRTRSPPSSTPPAPRSGRK